jgi:hypothetical protein
MGNLILHRGLSARLEFIWGLRGIFATAERMIRQGVSAFTKKIMRFFNRLERDRARPP